MDWSQLPSLLLLYLVSAGFIVASLAAVVFVGGANMASVPTTSLAIHDRIVRAVLRGLGALLLAVKVPLVFGIVTPAPGFEWLDRPELLIAAVAFIIAGDMLPRKDEADAAFGSREWFKKHLGPLGLTAIALAALYVGATRFIGE